MRSIPKRNEKKRDYLLQNRKFFIPLQSQINMVPIVQLVRMSDCGSEGRGFEPHLAPSRSRRFFFGTFFVITLVYYLNLGKFVRIASTG